jgi:hypothetical protein
LSPGWLISVAPTMLMTVTTPPKNRMRGLN